MRLAFAVWCLLSLIWGSTWFFIKIGLRDVPPFSYASMRFVVALFPLLGWWFLRRARTAVTNRDLLLIAVTGWLTFSINYALVYWGETYISVGVTAILYCTLPLFGQVLAHFSLPDEKFTWAKLAGILMGIAGVAVIFADRLQLERDGAVWGAMAIVGASFFTALAGVLIKRHGKRIDSLTMTTGQMCAGLPPLLLIGFALEGNPLSHSWTPSALAAMGYLAIIGSALAFLLFNWLIKNMAVTKTQLIPLSSTLVAVLLGALFLGETLHPRTVLGAGFIMLGFLCTLRDRPRAPLPPPGIPPQVPTRAPGPPRDQLPGEG